MTNLYFGKAVDVDRVLLVRYPEKLNLRKLANESSVSLGEAFKVSRALINERMALRESNRSELKLMAPSELLERLAKVIISYQIQNSLNIILKKMIFQDF